MGYVYGSSDVFDDTRDSLVSLMNTLTTTMSGSTTPHLETVQDSHNAVIASFNTASVDFIGYDSFPSGLDAGIITEYDMSWSVRVHTGYIGSAIDTQKITRLMDSVKNYLNTNKMIAQSSNHRIIAVTGGSIGEFTESYTVGGELYVNVVKRESHVQE